MKNLPSLQKGESLFLQLQKPQTTPKSFLAITALIVISFTVPPCSRRTRMDCAHKAKQFAPFAALRDSKTVSVQKKKSMCQ